MCDILITSRHVSVRFEFSEKHAYHMHNSRFRPPRVMYILHANACREVVPLALCPPPHRHTQISCPNNNTGKQHLQVFVAPLWCGGAMCAMCAGLYTRCLCVHTHIFCATNNKLCPAHLRRCEGVLIRY